MIQKRKLLAIFMAAAMAWQGFSLAQAEEIGPGVVSQSTISDSSENSGIPSEEDIRIRRGQPLMTVRDLAITGSSALRWSLLFLVMHR